MEAMLQRSFRRLLPFERSGLAYRRLERFRFLRAPPGVLGPLDLPLDAQKGATTITSFADLGISQTVVRALARRDITEPFPVQQMVVRDALAGHDLLVQSPTGSGKTLAFGIPLVELLEPGAGDTSALVLAPTRELAAQIVEELRSIADARGLRIAAVYGGVGFAPQIKAARRADILVATPGRLEDLIDRGVVSLGQVQILVLDEADRMLDMGFKPAVSRIVGLTPERRQTLFFSATLEGATGKIATAFTRDARRHTQEKDRRETDRHRAPLPPRRLPERQARPPGRPAARRRGQQHAGLRPHQARCRPAREAASEPRARDPGDARRQKPAPARTGACPVRCR